MISINILKCLTKVFWYSNISSIMLIVLIKIKGKKMKERNILDNLTESLFLNIDHLGSMSYLIALEAFRRGIKVDFKYSFNEDDGRFSESTIFGGTSGVYFTLSKNGKKYDFIRGLSSVTNVEDSQIADNKILAKNKMKSNGVVVPEGILYHKERTKTDENKSGVFIIKPNYGSHGDGFVNNLSFKEAIDIANERGFDHVIEEQVYGEEYRVYVVNNNAVSALKRLKPTLVGDGVKTVLDLYNEKLELKKNNIAYQKKAMPTKQEVEEFIQQQDNMAKDIWNHILPKGEVLVINNSNSVSQGGDLIECLESLPKKVKDEAIKASDVLSIPFSGVDIIYDKKQEKPFVLEVNCNPYFRLVSTKLEGYINQAYNDISVAIIDFHFPDSKRIKGLENINFSFNYITKVLSSGMVSNVGLPAVDESWLYREIILKKDEEEKNKKIYNITRTFGAYSFFYTKKDSPTVLTVLAPKKNMENILSYFSK